jgi:catechol 2,3-dioxygenase-like lactoylglutathione lyase family enzyme
MNRPATVGSTVMFVSDLNKSVTFYRDVFGCEVTINKAGAVLLRAPGGFQIYLRSVGKRAAHPSGNIGVQYLMWTTDSTETLEQFEKTLRDRGCYTYTHTDGGVTFVEGHDPDGIPAVVAQPSPEHLPRRMLSPRVYSW